MKKILITFVLLLATILTYSNENSVDDKIKKYAEYKKLVTENREKQIKKNLPSPQEIDIYYTQEKLRLEKERLEYEKKLAYDRLEAERRRENLINAAIIGGIGYGTYRVGRHHHWW
ncbi:Uncharacterised protein [Fusobacterium necrogenes]|uniref:Adhesion protein FadA n=1 Tax=Fusobacterium necrogenes TaxID=858 RepID=A0A377GX32_9FUSO|nr:hypothetical protein [Fusobacterium necrogenes]STO31550.1 Uncharacterised protein [Fusobacterium necrogenes]